MDLSHTQPKSLDAEQAWGKTIQIGKNTLSLEVCGHVSTELSKSSFQNWRFACITPFGAFETNSQVMFVVEDMSR